MIGFVRAMRFVFFRSRFFRPYGAGFNLLARFPRLAPWAAFFRRFAAGAITGTDLFLYSAYSIAAVIFALFSSMAETEQYFSFDSFTASSIAFFETLPLTTYFNLISV